LNLGAPLIYNYYTIPALGKASDILFLVHFLFSELKTRYFGASIGRFSGFWPKRVSEKARFRPFAEEKAGIVENSG
jgi:hypothetical protein